jgi:predicted DCC family thiol-disulfide oxidoreductase YuxK|tara:strand:- start:55 stop:486 length:432 start_codon:yes stop_codon:yes gene_type:complete
MLMIIFESMNKQSTHSIILFDGVCNLCNGAVNFVINRDPGNVFKFTPLQEKQGVLLLKKHAIDAKMLDSIVLIENGNVYIKSSAALRIAKKMSNLWPLFFALLIIPRFMRDGVYDFIAKNRYKWFGKKEQCMIPTPGLREKFL